MSKELTIAKNNLIFEGLAGSHSYGTNTDQSDTDKRGIFIAPRNYYVGLDVVEQVEIPGEDTVIYELRKFVKLAAESNPNIIELLFTGPENILVNSSYFQKLRDNRHLFLSRKAKFTFSGYAIAQLKRIKGHHKWISRPQPEREPQLLDFAKILVCNGTSLVDGQSISVWDLPDAFARACLEDGLLIKVNEQTYRIYSSPNFKKPAISSDGRTIQYVDISEDRLIARSEDMKFLGVLVIQRGAYKTAHREWKDYWKWKRERNPVRAELEEKYKFDCKHASHLIRLLRMAKEILITGEVIVRRPDAEELLAIRNGAKNYEEIIAEATGMEAELDSLYEKSPLPHSSDKQAISKLLMEVTEEFWDTSDFETFVDREKGIVFPTAVKQRAIK